MNIISGTPTLPAWFAASNSMPDPFPTIVKRRTLGSNRNEVSQFILEEWRDLLDPLIWDSDEVPVKLDLIGGNRPKPAV